MCKYAKNRRLRTSGLANPTLRTGNTQSSYSWTVTNVVQASVLLLTSFPASPPGIKIPERRAVPRPANEDDLGHDSGWVLLITARDEADGEGDTALFA